MPAPAVRCPACGHALFALDEPAWPARVATPSSVDTGATTGPLLLRVTEAAALLGVSRSSLYQLVASGRIPVVRLRVIHEHVVDTTAKGERPACFGAGRPGRLVPHGFRCGSNVR